MTSLAQSWYEEGESKGIQDGIKIGEAKLIKMMINNGTPIDTIAQITSLSVVDIEKLKSSLTN